jgi:hypothetical protein
MCINNNKRINDDYGRHQDVILHFETPMDTPKNFFQIYEQFGHAPPKKVRQPYTHWITEHYLD